MISYLWNQFMFYCIKWPSSFSVCFVFLLVPVTTTLIAKFHPSHSKSNSKYPTCFSDINWNTGIIWRGHHSLFCSIYFPESKYANRVDFILFLLSFCFFLLSPWYLPCYYYKIVRTYSSNPKFLTKPSKQEFFWSKKGLREDCMNWPIRSYMLTVVIVLRECI